MNEAQRCERKRTGRSAAFPRRPVSLIIKTQQLAEWPDVEMISSHSCIIVVASGPLPLHELYQYFISTGTYRTEQINKNLTTLLKFYIKYVSTTLKIFFVITCHYTVAGRRVAIRYVHWRRRLNDAALL